MTLPVLLRAALFPLQRLRPGLLLLCWLLLLGGCTGLSRIPEGQYLYTGATVEVKATTDVPDADKLQEQLEPVLKPEPNKSFLGMCPALWINQHTKEPKKEKGLKHWLKYGIGEKPVLLSDADTGRTRNVMRNRLHNLGYFKPEVQGEIKKKKKTASIDWTVTVVKPYVITKLVFPQGPNQLEAQIRQLQAGSLLKEGQAYNLPTFIQERVRIDSLLKNLGYYYFNPDYLLFQVDSTHENRTLSVYLQVKPLTPANAKIPYRLKNIYVYTDYSLGRDTVKYRDSLVFDHNYYFPNEDQFRSRHIIQGIFLRQGELYTRKNHTLTVKRLLGLGIFKYADVRFQIVDSTGTTGLLNTSIYLTPQLKKSLRLQFELVSKSNNFAGPGFTVSFRNRNAMRGAELLTVNLNTNYETQVGGRGSALNSYELGLRTELLVPRFITPFKVRNPRTEFTPKTRFQLGASLLNRVQYFQMAAFNASYGYVWKPRQTVTHEITPINLQYAKLLSTTEPFVALLDTTPFLKRSFENQAILGGMYAYTYTTQPYHDRKNHYFFNGTIDIAGNLARGAQRLTTGRSATPEEPYTLFRQAYSHYTRFTTDFRYYYSLTKQVKLATRLLTGIGIPYGNSASLPYIKQFSIGGTNSIRAFPARGIGPGTYRVPQTQALSYFDQVGDLKLEGNLELRFPLAGLMKGAVFLDAGNIWLVNEDPGRPGGKFNSSTFYQQLAVGTGFGIRFDVQFFVLRFDLGLPLQRPGESLKFGGYTFANRKSDNNMILNIAIGYPF